MTTIEVRVGPLSCAWPSIPPGVIAACRHLQAVTHQVYREGFAAAVDHAVLYFDAFAKNAAASCKKSRSFLTRASSRFMATIPSSPRLPMTLECLRTAALGFTTPAPRHIGIDPSSCAAWRVNTQDVRGSSIASRLNSVEYFLRFAMTHRLGYCHPVRVCT